MPSRSDRPILCPCPKTCLPLYNSLAGDERVKDGDLNEGYSGDCMGRMAQAIEYIYNGCRHGNDLNHCIFTPLKGIVRFQINQGDLESMWWMVKSVLQILEPVECCECGDNRLTAQFLIIEGKRYCSKCAVRLGLITYHPGPEGEPGRRWW